MVRINSSGSPEGGGHPLKSSCLQKSCPSLCRHGRIAVTPETCPSALPAQTLVEAIRKSLLLLETSASHTRIFAVPHAAPCSSRRWLGSCSRSSSSQPACTHRYLPPWPAPRAALSLLLCKITPNLLNFAIKKVKSYHRLWSTTVWGFLEFAFEFVVCFGVFLAKGGGSNSLPHEGELRSLEAVTPDPLTLLSML